MNYELRIVMNLVKVFLTEGFVRMNHTITKDLQYGGFEDEIYPGLAYQYTKEEHTSSGVKGEDVGDGH